TITGRVHNSSLGGCVLCKARSHTPSIIKAMDVVYHRSYTDGVLAANYGEIEVSVVVVLGTKRDGELAHSGVPVRNAHVRSKSNSILRGRQLHEVRRRNERLTRWVIELAKVRIRPAIVNIEDNRRTEQVCISNRHSLGVIYER